MPTTPPFIKLSDAAADSLTPTATTTTVGPSRASYSVYCQSCTQCGANPSHRLNINISTLKQQHIQAIGWQPTTLCSRPTDAAYELYQARSRHRQ